MQRLRQDILCQVSDSVQCVSAVESVLQGNIGKLLCIIIHVQSETTVFKKGEDDFERFIVLLRRHYYLTLITNL